MSAPRVPGGVVSVYKKYTVNPVGIWEKVRRVLAVDPNRSSGVPLNPTYRNPAPGSVPAIAYTDPVTVPAADIAGNPYWMRDVRRGYPRPAVFKQNDVVGLLTLGSAAAPRIAKGEEGAKQLVAVKSENGVLSKVLEQVGVKEILQENGLPPLPGKRVVFNADIPQSYPSSYPCRSFA